MMPLEIGVPRRRRECRYAGRGAPGAPAVGRRLAWGLALVLGSAVPARAATWYLGAFSGSTPLDDADCGAGKGAHPDPHPCATLAYWTSQRAQVATPGAIVRLTGAFGPAASGSHCIIPGPGVTYEGRTPADEQPEGFDAATVDAALTLPYPCHSGAINCRNDSACSGFSNFTLRYLTLANATGLGGEGNQLMPGDAIQSGLTIDHVRFTGSRANGLIIGSGVSNEDNPCDGVRNVRDVTILDSQFDHNTRATAQAGLWLTCTDGGVIRRSTAFDNRDDTKTQADCAADPDTEGCDGRNGFHFGGWVNGLIADSSAYRNGYYNYDFSGNGPSSQCDAPTHDVLVERATSYDAASAHYSFSHCNHDITIRNSFAWGHGIAVNQYACAYRLRLYNNTFWTPKALQLFANCRECDLRNNVFHCAADVDCVYIDFATRHALTTWSHNVVVNEGSGLALGVLDSNNECVGTPGGACDCPGSSFAVCPNRDPQSPGCPAPWKDSASRRFGNDELAAFVADAMFGDETGAGDRWGAAPAVVDAAAAGVAGLHLRSNDRIARDAGAPVAVESFGPATDWDDDVRPEGAGWDIGADEVVCRDGDPDADGVCGADDNCASAANGDQHDLDADGAGDPCDPEDAPLTKVKARLRWSRGATRPGSLRVVATSTGAGATLTTSQGLGLAVGAGDLRREFAWSASECAAGAGRTVCTSGRGQKAIVEQIGARARAARKRKEVAAGYAFSATLRDQDLPSQAGGPVTVDLAEGGLVSGLDRVGVAARCTGSAKGLRCRSR